MTRLVVREVFKTVMTAEWRDDLSNELCFMFCQLAFRCSVYPHAYSVASENNTRLVVTTRQAIRSPTALRKYGVRRNATRYQLQKRFTCNV